jgi:hypothetical protein
MMLAVSEFAEPFPSATETRSHEPATVNVSTDRLKENFLGRAALTSSSTPPSSRRRC